MSKEWPYAELTKTASQNGGPEKYTRAIRLQGRMDMLPVVGVAIMLGPVLCAVTKKIGSKFREIIRKRKDDCIEAESFLLECANEKSELQSPPEIVKNLNPADSADDG